MLIKKNFTDDRTWCNISPQAKEFSFSAPSEYTLRVP